MNYDKLVPCDDYPFRKKGGIPLRALRIKEIADMMLNSQGGTFPCHKTTQSTESGERCSNENSVHCAGALIFAEKNGTATQMMRICERIGMYDAAKLMSNQSVVDSVWDTRSQWLRAGK